MDCEINVDTQPQMSPCITARRGGRAIKKISRSSADREAGVVFRWMQRKTTPAASASVAARYFLDDAATPPCGDARRGINALLDCIPFHSRLLYPAPYG